MAAPPRPVLEEAAIYLARTPRIVAVQCACGSTAQGKRWPFIGLPFVEHEHHCRVGHASRAPWTWAARVWREADDQ